jgi:cation diffusion facilitator CzcD-associated flavoprotein CzcO
MGDYQVAIVGAGPAGISTAVALKDRGVTPLLIDRAENVGSSWRARYDRLRLNTGRQFSHLPGRRYPKGTPTFPTRDQVVEHLERGAHEHGIELLLGSDVERLEPDRGGWSLETSTGLVGSRQVVVATGYEHSPLIPDWPGRETFAGELLHSSQYRNPRPYEGRRVLVIGPGCSGMEIAHDVATGGAAKVWLAVRTPPNIIKRQGPAGLPGDVIATPLYHAPVRLADAMARFGRKMDFGDLREYGLPVPEEGVFARNARLGVAPTIVDKVVIEAIKARQIEIVRGMEAFADGEAVLADGARVDPDAVICATGYRRGLEPIVGHLGVLDERGRPRIVGEKPAANGLRFIGYIPRPSQIGATAKQARRAARAIARELR